MAIDDGSESFTPPPPVEGNTGWTEIATSCQTPTPVADTTTARVLPQEFGAGTLQLVDNTSTTPVSRTGTDIGSGASTTLENRSDQPGGRGGAFDNVRGFINQMIDRFVPQQYRDMARGIVDQVGNMFRDGSVSVTPRDGGHDVSLNLTNTPIAQLLGQLPGNISAGRLSFHLNRGRISNVQGLQVGGQSVHSADLHTGRVTTSGGSFVIPRLGQ